MTKLRKIGLSALCGSLAAFSATAGELTVSGGATVTWSQNSKETTGNPLGMASAVSFAGSGELDGGQTVSLAIDNNDRSAFSVASMSLGTNSIGTFKLSLGTGGVGVDSYDDKMPSAWEETWGTSLGTGVDLISGVGASTSLEWTLPTVGGVTLAAAVAPVNDGVQSNDKSGSGSVGGEAKGMGYDVTLNINPTIGGDVLSGLNIFGGYSTTEKSNPSLKAGSNAETNEDVEEGTVGFTYAFGPVELGTQVTGEYLGARGATSNTEVAGYKNVMWAVAFNVNDNLSLSYAEMDSKKMWENQGTNESVQMNVESYQLAYTMGGASIKIAETEVSQALYSTAANQDKDGTTVALTLAF